MRAARMISSATFRTAHTRSPDPGLKSELSARFLVELVPLPIPVTPAAHDVLMMSNTTQKAICGRNCRMFLKK